MTRLVVVLCLLAGGVHAQGRVIECQPFEFEPMGQLFNRLATLCYSMHGGDKLPDGGRVVNFVLRHTTEGCGKIPRLIVKVRKDGMACIWWEADKE